MNVAGYVDITVDRARRAIALYDSLKSNPYISFQGTAYENSIEYLRCMVAVAASEKLTVSSEVAHCLYWLTEYSHLAPRAIEPDVSPEEREILLENSFENDRK